MLQETERGHHLCHFVVILIHEVATWYILLYIVKNLLWYAVHCNRINQGFKPYAANLCVSSSEWFNQYVHCWLRCQGASWPPLSCVTLSWPVANVWYFATCCLDITSLPYTFVNCQRISDTDTLYPQKAYKSSEFKAKPVFQVGNYVELMHLCSWLTCALNFVTQPKRSSPLLYQQHSKFQSVHHLE
jgi:hypothetical protein